MRNRLFTAAAIMALVVPTVIQAQTATVTASATVQASLSATTTNNLNFGTLDINAHRSILPSDPLSVNGLAGRGQVHVQHNSNVSVMASVPSVLTNSATGKTLGFSATCALSDTSGAEGTAVPGGCGPNAFTFTAPSPGTLGSTYILVGGAVTGASDSGIGLFAGNVVFTLTSTN
jgi:hypothetical protein